MRRCFICEADTLEPTTRRLVYPDGRRRVFPIACASCGALLEEGADSLQCRAHLAEALARDAFHLELDVPYGLDIYTLRTAATRHGRGVRVTCEADRIALLRPHAELSAVGELFDLTPTHPGTVSLGLLCRPHDLEAVLAGLQAHTAWTGDVAILVDALDTAPASATAAGFPHGAVRIAGRPLADNFAAQRNALQDLSRCPWMLQLDADEALPPATGNLLPALAALADEGEALSIGMPRRNRVDGILSDVYPDVQYRLNRARVRFRGRVHERPDLGGDWRRSFIALHGAIEHRLSRAHVLARSRRYEAMDPGQGRTEEETALLRPYRP